jgi:hypothetical protein
MKLKTGHIWLTLIILAAWHAYEGRLDVAYSHLASSFVVIAIGLKN